MKEGYICKECAVKKGALPSILHVFTSHQGKCSFCNKLKTLNHTSDWNWPHAKELERNREV